MMANVELDEAEAGKLGNCQGSSMKNDLKVDWPMQLCRRCMVDGCEMAFN